MFENRSWRVAVGCSPRELVPERASVSKSSLAWHPAGSSPADKKHSSDNVAMFNKGCPGCCRDGTPLSLE